MRPNLEKVIYIDDDTYKRMLKGDLIGALISLKIMDEYKDKSLEYLIPEEEALKYFQNLTDNDPLDKAIIRDLLDGGIHLKDVYLKNPEEDYMEALKHCEQEGINVSDIKEAYREIMEKYKLK